MRTTGKGLYKWLKEQKEVRWPRRGGGFLVYLNYNGIRCAGVITKTRIGKKLVSSEIKIRPLLSTDKITETAGESVTLTFSEN